MPQRLIQDVNQAREQTKLKTASNAKIEYTTKFRHMAQFKVWLARGGVSQVRAFTEVRQAVWSISKSVRAEVTNAKQRYLKTAREAREDIPEEECYRVPELDLFDFSNTNQNVENTFNAIEIGQAIVSKIEG